MKQDLLTKMDELKIDEKIRGLISQLWSHSYITTSSCQGLGKMHREYRAKNHNPNSSINYKGHSFEAYVLFKGGDGWFERNADKYGLTKVNTHSCCSREEAIHPEAKKQALKYFPNYDAFLKSRRACGICGSGVNGFSAYIGILKNPLT